MIYGLSISWLGESKINSMLPYFQATVDSLCILDREPFHTTMYKTAEKLLNILKRPCPKGLAFQHSSASPTRQSTKPERVLLKGEVY